MSDLNNPIVGSKGLWTLKTPFDSLLPTNTSLECTAISNYGQMFSMGMDPYTEYYSPNGLTKEVYQDHFDNGGRIVFVKTDKGIRYSFPLHYLESYPIGTGVNYCSFGIGIRLGALPLDDANIDLLITQIQELCHLTVGVEIQAESMAMSEVFIVENLEHERIKSARAALMKAKTPALEQIADLTNVNEELRTKLQLAEAKLIEQKNEIEDLKKPKP